MAGRDENHFNPQARMSICEIRDNAFADENCSRIALRFVRAALAAGLLPTG
jgi:hypothetical protein